MAWKQISVEAGDLDAEDLSGFFEGRGAISVTFVDAADQPLFEPDPGATPLWSATRVSALFDASADIGALREQLGQVFGPDVLGRVAEESLENRDWERAWLDRFQPMRFGERLWVCPDGQRPAADDTAVFIDLDPGLAFGTGTHPTTALCLRWLDAFAPRDLDVLDYGCGSGILAIAALKLGARRVWGVDIDEQALWASRENAERNAVGERLLTGLPDALPTKKFDVLLANILANPLLSLVSDLSERVRPGGDLVLSGILAEQAEVVGEAYRPWFEMSEPVIEQEWVRLHGRRR